MKKQRNRYLEKIAAAVGEINTVQAVEVFVRRYTQVGDSLESTAKGLGISEIVREEMPFDGGIFETGGGRLVVKINSSSPAVRQRFTLAHEVGHLLLSSWAGGKNCTNDRNLEGACDAIAAELLMPAQETTFFVKQQREASPERLKAVADAFAVSLHSAALRVHRDLKLWRRVAGIGMWRLGRSAEEIWFVGKRPWTSRREHFSAFESALASRETIVTQEAYAEGYEKRAVMFRVLNLGNRHLLALVS